jgi:hypothetical protein
MTSPSLNSILFLAVVASCSTTKQAQRPELGPDTWALMQSACTRAGTDTATCDIERLKTAMRNAAQAEYDRDVCAIDLKACKDLADVDCALWAGRVATCEADLNSLWRSPWLWGGLALGLGFGLGAAVGR